MSRRVLLVSAPLAGGRLPGGVCPSLSNVALGSVLKAAGATVQVLDPSVDLTEPGEALPAAEVLQRTVEAILKAAPDVVGASCMSTVEGRFGVSLARRLAQVAPTLPVVLGGVWATGNAEALLARFPEIWAVVSGPGEAAILALAEHGLDRPQAVPGLVYRDGAGLVTVPGLTKAPLAAPLNLDLLARPERYDIFCWLTSRGCPFHCSFCTETLTSPGFHTEPALRVAEDVAALRARGPNWYLWLCDPLFGVKRPHVSMVAQALSATPHRFLIESRVDVLHPDDVPRLAEAGLDLVYFGLEAVSRRALVALDKLPDSEARHRAYLDGARALVETCLRHNVLPVLGLVQPAPGDTPEDLAFALSFLDELRALPEKLGPAAHGLAPCFHAFPLRLDRGAPLETQALPAGARFGEVRDLLFEDRLLVRPSATVDEAAAEAFRGAVRQRNVADPEVRRRLLSSYPRPFLAFEP